MLLVWAAPIFGFGQTTKKPDVAAQAAALVKAGRVDEAEAMLRSASAADPDSADLHAALGQLLLSERKYEDAVMELGTAAQQKPDSRTYNMLAAEALIGWQHYPTAIQFLKAVQPRFGNDAHFHYEFALAYYYQSDLNATRRELEEAVRLSPNFERAEFLLANCLVVSGETTKALAILRKLAEKHPSNAFYWATLGMKVVHVDTGGTSAEALTDVRKALALAPNDPYVQMAAGTVFTQTGNFKDARPLLENLEKLSPEELEPHALLIRVYARLGERELAQKESAIVEQLQKQAAAQHPNGPPGGALSNPPQP